MATKPKAKKPKANLEKVEHTIPTSAVEAFRKKHNLKSVIMIGASSKGVAMNVSGPVVSSASGYIHAGEHLITVFRMASPIEKILEELMDKRSKAKKH